ncbi:ABC transporter substrate-binding protein [Inquilinus limosus]|uniref:ABC transporter substrate-binding protein n=1 Tax=Inquilinus limosus TaxID=171674 RepID=UPI00040F20B8|nr:ABC transporter substrate-binding protein [Inquilinus limosus]
MPARFPLSRRALLSGLGAAAATAALRPRLGRAQDPVKGGTLTVAADTEPRNLNPALVASNGVFYVASKVIEPLAEMAFDGRLTPVLATRWEGSADGRTVTFTLRDGVLWHDGRPFSAADVAFSATELWAKRQNLGRVVFKDLEGVDTPDQRTAVFRFRQPTPLQLIENALPALTAVVPKHLFEGTEIDGNPHNEQLVGTGPFRYREHRPGEYYLLERNPDYWNAGLPYLDRIVYRVLPDRGAIAAAHEAGEIQLSAFSAVPLEELERLRALPDIAVVRKGYEGITYQLTVEINHRRRELQDVRVRRAIAHAIDQSYVVGTIFRGYAEAATGPVPKTGVPFYTPDVPTYPYDPHKAEALLDEAGFPRRDGGARFALRLLPAPWFEQTRQMGDYLRQALQAVGIDVTLVTNDAAGHTRAVYTDHAFDLAIGSPVYRNDPAISTTILYRGGLPSGVPFSNQYGYDDPAMNDLIDRAAAELDRGRRIDLYQQFQQRASDQLPLIVAAEFTFITVASRRLHNIATNPRWATSSWAETWMEG